MKYQDNTLEAVKRSNIENGSYRTFSDNKLSLVTLYNGQQKPKSCAAKTSF